MLKLARLAGAVALALFVSANPARASSIVINGDFETGDLTGWTDAGNTGWNIVTAGQGVAGSFGVDNGAVSSPSILEQVLPTTTGATYDLSIFERQDGDGFISVYWGGTQILSNSGSPFPYTQLSSLGLLATGPSTLLQVFSQDDEGFNQFDNITVEEVSSPVPEPASVLLLGTGLVAVFRRRFSAKRS